MATKTKTTTVRIPEKLFHQLEAVAAVENKSVSEVIRDASEDLVVRCSADKTFRNNLAKTIKVLEARPMVFVDVFNLDDAELASA